MRKTFIAAASIATLLFTASAASAQVCVFGIMIAAAAVGSQQHRELTSEEAATCGLSSLFEKPKDKKDAEKKTKKKKIAKQTKPE